MIISSKDLEKWLDVDIERLESSIKIKSEYLKMNMPTRGPNGTILHFIAREIDLYESLKKILKARQAGWTPADLLDADQRIRELAAKHFRDKKVSK